ncbi:MAG: aspartate aminotransferase family protein [Clostridiales Family XIII bacterium]|nr:aspartate aminotransferase family protein [Clostridiales Family XIII bacterium]
MKENYVLSLDFNREYPRIVSGKGIYMYTEDGKEIIDGASGPVLVSLGHGIDEIANAIAEQARKIAFVHRDDAITDVLEESCKTFNEASDGDMLKTFQVAGGSEANEIAIKLVRKYHVFRGNRSKYKILSRWQSYHGSSMGALSLTGFTKRKTDYDEYLFNHGKIPPCYCYRCWYNKEPNTCDCECARALEDLILTEGPETVAGFIAEPVSGMSLCAAEPLNKNYFKQIREICDKYDVALILDEVMTGFGRTGTMFAYKEYGIVPDLVSTGKAVSGGYFPLAAVSITEKFYKGMYDNNGNFPPGYSWSGNPLGAAAELAAYKYLKEHDLVENCRKMGIYLQESMQELAKKHEIIGDVRGRGLMIGAELVKNRKTKESFNPELKIASQVQTECLDKGNMIIEASSGSNRGQSGDSILLSPAFVVNKEQIDEIVKRVDAALGVIEERNLG